MERTEQRQEERFGRHMKTTKRMHKDRKPSFNPTFPIFACPGHLQASEIARIESTASGRRGRKKLNGVKGRIGPEQDSSLAFPLSCSRGSRGPWLIWIYEEITVSNIKDRLCRMNKEMAGSNDSSWRSSSQLPLSSSL